MAPGGLTCECGATIRDGANCEAIYYEILAAEQQDLTLARWHTVVVCAYLLQHPSHGHYTYLDGQFRLLQLYRDKGLVALLRVTSHQRARNRHGVRAGYDMAPLVPYASLPRVSPPVRFMHGFADLHALIGDLGKDGYRAYEWRLDAIVDATVNAWMSRNVANDGEKW